MATAVETLSIPTEALTERDGVEILKNTLNKTKVFLILPSRVATQEKPSSRQHETRKFSKYK